MSTYKSQLTKEKNLQLKNLDKRKTVEPKKCVVTLKLPFINISSEVMEKKIRQLIKTTYYAANPGNVFISKPILTPGGKNVI